MQDWEKFMALEKRIAELEAANNRLNEQLDAANYIIQTLNRVIAGDVE